MTNPAPTLRERTRKWVTTAVLLSILITALWSIANIAEAASHYHAGPFVIGLGIAFGLANAISVYVLATSRTHYSRRPALLGTIVFGVGSGIIQFHLYHDILQVVLIPAITFAALGPLTEAILAWLEAGLHAEDAVAHRDREIERIQADADAREAAAIAEARKAQRQALAAQEEAQQAQQAARKAQQALEEALRRQEAAAAAHVAPAPQPAPQPATVQLSSTNERYLNAFLTIMADDNGKPWTAEALADEHKCSLRSAQRHLKAGVEAGVVIVNGDGGYHPA